MNKHLFKRITYIVALSIVPLASCASTLCGPGAYEPVVVARFGASSTPRWSSDGVNLIVGVDDSIKVVRIDGSQLWDIPKASKSEHKQSSFALSRNDQIAYVNYHYNNGLLAFLDSDRHKYEIRLVNIKGTEDKQLIELDHMIHNLEWSPDASRIAFRIVSESISRLGTIMAADGSDVRIIESLEGRNRPEWSTDGKRILLLEGSKRVSESNYIHTISTVEWDGSDRKIVVEEIGLAGMIPPSPLVWSPADNLIYFAKKDGYSTQTLYSVSSDGSEQRKGGVLGERLVVRHPTMSPDGTEMIFVSDYSYPRESELHAIGTNDAQIRSIAINDYLNSLHEHRTLHASWSPEGDRIAVLNVSNRLDDSEDPVVLFTMNPDGSDANLLIKRENGILLPGHGEPLPLATILPVDEDLRSTP